MPALYVAETAHNAGHGGSYSLGTPTIGSGEDLLGTVTLQDGRSTITTPSLSGYGALTLASKIDGGAGAHTGCFGVYYYENPPTGAQTMTGSTACFCCAGAITISGWSGNIGNTDGKIGYGQGGNGREAYDVTCDDDLDLVISGSQINGSSINVDSDGDQAFIHSRNQSAGSQAWGYTDNNSGVGNDTHMHSYDNGSGFHDGCIAYAVFEGEVSFTPGKMFNSTVIFFEQMRQFYKDWRLGTIYGENLAWCFRRVFANHWDRCGQRDVAHAALYDDPLRPLVEFAPRINDWIEQSGLIVPAHIMAS